MLMGKCVWVFVLIGTLGTACANADAARANEPAKSIDFNRDIRPILSENCYQCHGPDKNKRKADLRLDTKDGLFEELGGAVPVVPGKPDDSDLLRRISLPADDEDHMPPIKANKSVKPEQVALVRRWIEEGAAWKGHWSYIKPTLAAEPAIDDAGIK